jgi:hypothetical protein
MDEGRKRVLGIIAGILVARHLKTTEDLFDNRHPLILCFWTTILGYLRGPKETACK